MRYRSSVERAETSGFNLGGKQWLSGGRLWSVWWSLLTAESLSFSRIVHLSCFKFNCHFRVEGDREEISLFPLEWLLYFLCCCCTLNSSSYRAH